MILSEILTVSGHSNGEAFLETTILTPIPVEPDHEALPIPKTPVLDLLLDTPPEESLQPTAPRHLHSKTIQIAKDVDFVSQVIHLYLI